MTVIFWSLDNQRGTATMEDGRVVFDDLVPVRFVREWREDGVPAPGKGPAGDRIVFPADGEVFLRALPFAVSGPYFRAELVEDHTEVVTCKPTGR